MLALGVETWIWYAVVMLIAICRFASRALTLGSAKRLQLDDLVMVFTLAAYTVVIVTINIVANVDTNLLPPGFDVATLSHSDILSREYGSKMVLVVEQCQCATVWGSKACILIMYSRLTVGRVENVAIKTLGAYVALGFVVMEILYFGVWCRPFHNYWAVPTPNIQCSAAIDHLITNAVFNISSDVILLAIALPMFIRSRIPTRKKIALVGVFGLGVFVILCAILNKYYSFTQPFGSQWTFWYTRESSTSLLVANLPFLYTLLRRVFHTRFLDGTTNRNASTTMARGPGTATQRTQQGLKQTPSFGQGGYSPAADGARDDLDIVDFLTTPTWYGEEENCPAEKPPSARLHGLDVPRDGNKKWVMPDTDTELGTMPHLSEPAQAHLSRSHSSIDAGASESSSYRETQSQELGAKSLTEDVAGCETPASMRKTTSIVHMV